MSETTTKLGAKKSDVWEKPAGDGQSLRSLLATPHAINRIQAVLPKHLTAERMLNISLSVINAPSKGSMRLLDATPASILQCIINLAEVGLEPGGPLQHAYLIPYRDNGRVLAKVMFSYRGLVELARRSGQIVQVEAREVYEKDDFRIVYGFNQDLHHVPFMKGDPGAPFVAYALARFKDGGVDFGHMTKEAIYKIRDRSEGYRFQVSKGGKANPWFTDEMEMWKKTIIRRQSKLWPQSPELQRAHEIEDSQDEAELAIDVTPPSRPFQVVEPADAAPPPPPPRAEPEEAEVVEPQAAAPAAESAEDKLVAPAADSADPFEQMLRRVLVAETADALDEAFVEANRNRKEMSPEDWALVKRARAQREAELSGGAA